MHALENNIKKLNLRIESACKQYQRNAQTVHLLAVSKTQPVDNLQNAYDLGLRQFGENYVSEAQEKIPALPDDIEWHFIGPIQSNKSRFIAENFDWVHSVDRLKIAKRMNEQRPGQLEPINCLIQVNISNEKQKAGIAADEAIALAKEITTLPNMTLRGFMAIPNPSQSSEKLENDFANMGQLLRQLRRFCDTADTLSMGMSKDFELAIKHGATIIRIGTDLFGARQQK
jgi:pyridoxal phosphate enzyme (YggS family)